MVIRAPFVFFCILISSLNIAGCLNHLKTSCQQSKCLINRYIMVPFFEKQRTVENERSYAQERLKIEQDAYVELTKFSCPKIMNLQDVKTEFLTHVSWLNNECKDDKLPDYQNIEDKIKFVVIRQRAVILEKILAQAH